MLTFASFFYVSCTSREIERAKLFYRELEALGYHPSHDWTVAKEKHLAEIGDPDEDTWMRELRTDMKGARDCNAFIVLLSDPMPRGAYAEMGAAFGDGGPTIHIVGKNPDHWMRAGAHYFHEDDEAALKWFADPENQTQ